MSTAKIATVAGRHRRPDRLAAVVAGVLVFLVYGWIAKNAGYPAGLEKTDYYALLAEGFRTGHLHLAKEAPAGLVRLSNPYDPAANAAFRGRGGLHDTSYYKGKLYLYFGVTPAVVLFLPYTFLTGTAFTQEYAVAVFCAIGFSAVAWLFCALRQRYFPTGNPVLTVAGVLALGLGTGSLVILTRPEVYEVAISCAYAMTMLSLAAVWRALVEPTHRVRWLALASFAYGLAVGARPSVLFGAIILLVPVVAEWRDVAWPRSWRRLWSVVLAAFWPVTFIGLGLLAYNYLRFDDPLEFGQGYQLAGTNEHTTGHVFSPSFFWFNFRIYFLEPMRWSARFPFVLGIRLPSPLPANYFGAENPFGVLPNIPLVCFALAAPLAWRGLEGEERIALRRLVAAVGLLFAACAITLCFFGGACSRYEVEFLPALVLLSMVGILGLERTLAGRPVLRAGMRGVCGALLLFSIAFNVLVNFGAQGYYSSLQNNVGYLLLEADRVPEAIARFRLAVRFNPDSAEAHCNWGAALFQTGRLPDAVDHFKAAVRINPGFAEAQNNLGIALTRVGDLAGAKLHFEAALKIRPDFADARLNLSRVETLLHPAPGTGPGL